MLSSQRGRRIVRPSVANGGTECDPRRVGAGSSKTSKHKEFDLADLQTNFQSLPNVNVITSKCKN